MKEMDEQTIMRDEIQQIFFGFSVTDLTEHYIVAFTNCIDQTMLSVETALLEEKPENAQCIKQGIKNLRNVYIEKMKVVIGQLQTEFEKVFHIPNNVILPVVGSANTDLTDQDIEKIIQEVNSLQDQLLQERVFLAKLEEQKRYFDDKVKPMMDRIKELLNFHNLNSISNQESLDTLIETLDKVVVEEI